MKWLAIIMLLASSSQAAPPPSSGVKGMVTERDLSAFIENDRALYDEVRRTDLTVGGKTITGTLTVDNTLTVGSDGITFSDGTTQTTAFVNIASSYSHIPNASGTNTAFDSTESVSTVTFTTNGGSIKCEVTGNISSTGNNATLDMWVTVDGEFVTGVNGILQSASQASASFQIPGASNLDTIAPTFVPLDGISAASHNFTLHVANSGGTWNIRDVQIDATWGCWEMGA